MREDWKIEGGGESYQCILIPEGGMGRGSAMMAETGSFSGAR